MPQIGLGLGDALDGIPPGGRAESKSIKLREDVPHPVRHLSAGTDLRQRLIVVFRLGSHEAAQVVRVVLIQDVCSKSTERLSYPACARVAKPGKNEMRPGAATSKHVRLSEGLGFLTRLRRGNGIENDNQESGNGSEKERDDGPTKPAATFALGQASVDQHECPPASDEFTLILFHPRYPCEKNLL